MAGETIITVMMTNSEDFQDNTYYGPSALDTAINSDDPEMLRSVILAGGDVNADLGDGWTPLHLAFDYAIDGMIQQNRDSPSPEAMLMIQILVSHGADPERRNQEGKRPLDSINTYAGSEQGFNSLVTIFRDVIPDLENKIQYLKQR